MQPTKLIIDAALAQTLHDFLHGNPKLSMREVEPLVLALRKLEPLPAPMPVEVKSEAAKAA